MEIQSRSEELKICQLQFMRLFNNIKIVQDGKEIKVHCVNGKRSRIFKSLENTERNSQFKLPLIIIERTGITKNDERISNINNEIKYRTHSSRLNYDLITPVPVDISYQVTIVSKYQNHIDRIIGNFIPFFNKDLFVRGYHPKFTDIIYSNQVVMDNDIQEERPDELDGFADDIVTATCNFTMKSYLFCGMDKQTSQTHTIQKIETVISCDPETGISNLISVITDTVYDGFVPQIGQINVGFYPVRLLSTYEQYFNFVDALSGSTYSETVELQKPHVDRMIWKIDESGEYQWLSGDYTPIISQ